jgi:aminopeptidase N
MKKLFWSIQILLILVFSNVVAQHIDSELSDKLSASEAAAFSKKINFQEAQNYALYDLIYQRMEWEVDPNIRYIRGKITSYIKSVTDNLSIVEFDLDSIMDVDSVTNVNNAVDFSREGDKLLLHFSEPLALNEIDSVSVYYQGEPNSTGFGSFTQAWHDNNTVPIIWTLSEPYGAKEWWPCKQSLSDKIDSIDVIVTSPEKYRTASHGILVSETVSEGKRTMHWKHRHPITTYLVAIAVTNYIEYSDFLELEDGRRIEILNYVYPESEMHARARTPVTADIMTIFNELIGEYPFADEKYGHAQFGWGGGMEHQTMSFMGSFSFGLIAHELVHQWFGNYITLASWQHIWLNEGFATYFTGLAHENYNAGLVFPNWKRTQVGIITSQPGGSVFVPDTTDVSRIFDPRLSYAKAGYLLHMLRWILGDKDFFNAIRNYYNDPEIANGFARHEQAVAHFEAAGDTNLTRFFDDWYYGEGFPVYSAQYTREDDRTIRFSLSQTTTHPSVSFFEMPVPVRVYNAEKTDSVDFRLYHTSNNQEFILKTDFTVSDIRIDPDYWLISKTDGIVNVPLTEYKEGIKVYPNPFTNQISIAVPGNKPIERITLYNAVGKQLYLSDDPRERYNWGHLPDGIYFLQLSINGILYERKIIKK